MQVTPDKHRKNKLKLCIGIGKRYPFAILLHGFGGKTDYKIIQKLLHS